MDPMQLFYIRHAQSSNNALFDQTDSTRGRSEDPELTEKGFRQASLLAEYLPAHEEYRFTQIYSSLMVRSIQTASLLGEALRAPLLAWGCVHERGGIFLEGQTGEPTGQPGKTIPELIDRFPNLIVNESFSPEGWWSRPFETAGQSLERARGFVKELLERHKDRRDKVAVVSHGSFYMDVISVLGELNGGIPRQAPLHNTGITRIDFIGDVPHLIYADLLDHLPPELVS